MKSPHPKPKAIFTVGALGGSVKVKVPKVKVKVRFKVKVKVPNCKIQN